MPTADRRRARLLCAVLFLAAACTGDDGGGPEGLSAEPFRLGLEAGDCFDRPASPDVESVPAVPCRRPHDLEAYATFELSGEDYPGQPTVAERAGARCEEAFEAYVGGPQDSSSNLIVVPYAPDRLAWDAGDRRVVCAVSKNDEQLTGSVQGTVGAGG